MEHALRGLCALAELLVSDNVPRSTDTVCFHVHAVYIQTCLILIGQMQLVQYAIVTFIRRRRPDVIADCLILEVAFPAGAVSQLQVLGLDFGDDPAVCEDRIGVRQPVVRRMRLTLLSDASDSVERVIDAAARPYHHADVESRRQPGSDQQSDDIQLHNRRSLPSALYATRLRGWLTAPIADLALCQFTYFSCTLWDTKTCHFILD